MYLWVGANASPVHVQNLFGAASQHQNIEKSKIIETDTPISTNVRSVINRINEQRNSMLKVWRRSSRTFRQARVILCFSCSLVLSLLLSDKEIRLNSFSVQIWLKTNVCRAVQRPTSTSCISYTTRSEIF